MNPELGLHFAAVFLSFFLRVAAGYCVCWMLNRLLSKPRQRFVLWTTFLLGSAAYWVVLAGREASALISPAGATGTTGAAPAVAHSFFVPAGWSHGVLVAIQFLGLVYGVTASLLIAKAAGRYLRLRLLLRQGIEPSEELNGLFLEICSDMGVSRARLVVLPGLKSPATAGWRRACVLLPEVCEELGATSQVADVLCHELVHVERRDYFWAGVGNLVCCLLFFHPAIWKARAGMILQGELACDEAVLNTRNGDRAAYAESLTYFVRLRMLQEGFSLGVDFAASTALGLRIRTILTAPEPLPWRNRISRATAGLALVAVLAVMAPALTVLFHFSQADETRALVQQPVKTAGLQARKAHHAQRREGERQPQSQDTLTTLRTRPYVPETPAYTMTSGNSRSGGTGVDQDSPVWKESRPTVQFPSVSNVVLTTLGQIAVSTRRGGHGRDSDDH
ncbi:MAG TPA: M56 family metallopeptidase [Candidatus Angelobacter sp.]|nr:M56 family metallopeptidase [Candidatus Angelobacter sp.]